MKLLHTIHSANPETGGPIEGVLQLSRANQDNGHEIEVVSLDAPDNRWLKDLPLVIHPLGPGRGKYGFAPQFRRWLGKHAREYDAVIVNGLWQYNGWAVWQTLRQTAIPYYVFAHGMLDPWFQKTYPLKHLKKLLYWFPVQRLVLRDSAAVFYTCEQERTLARRSFPLYQCRDLVIRYGTARPPPHPERAAAEFLEKFPHLRGQRTLLFLGRLHPKKGCDLLIKAVARLQSNGGQGAANSRPLHLVMAGPDARSWQETLTSLSRALGIEKQITWTGMLSGNLKWGALASAEAFILPSHQENFGIAVVEALACGLPVLISNQVNIWREVEEDGAGLIEPDDEEGVYRLLLRWLGLSEGQRAEMRRRARKSFAERFEIQQTAREFIAALEAYPGQKPYDRS